MILRPEIPLNFLVCILDVISYFTSCVCLIKHCQLSQVHTAKWYEPLGKEFLSLIDNAKLYAFPW